MQASNNNPSSAEDLVKLAREALDEARKSLELARKLTKKGESYLKLAATAQTMNSAPAEDSLTDDSNGRPVMNARVRNIRSRTVRCVT
jgi:hypothetical protein